MTRLGVPSGTAMFEQLESAYSESHRHYHTLEHIDACLDLYDEYRSLADNPDSVETAIWFHDMVYKTRSSKNEEESAEVARAFLLENGVAHSFADGVFDLILVTKHDAPVNGQDAELLVDIDLSILGESEPTFWRFEENVRKEYRWVPLFLYKKERAKILRSFLERDQIYSTAVIRERFESQARENLELAIARLG